MQMQSAKSTLLYCLFATAVFTGLQYMQGERDWLVLASSGAMFMVFTYFMLRLVNRVIFLVARNRMQKSAARREAERGPVEVAATSERADHNRRRRERRRDRDRPRRR